MNTRLTSIKEFSVPFQNHVLVGNWCDPFGDPTVFILHGAGASHTARFSELRSNLQYAGIGSLAFDFIGHGATGGSLQNSSLASRTAQAGQVVRSILPEKPLILWGSSMGAYNAIKLAQQYNVTALILSVPAVYHPDAYSIPFGPQFSEIIRQPRSWEQSDAWHILEQFKGHVLILQGTQDEVIPAEIPERIYHSAVHAASRCLFTIKGAGHNVIQYLEQHPQEFEQLIGQVKQIRTKIEAATIISSLTLV